MVFCVYILLSYQRKWCSTHHSSCLSDGLICFSIVFMWCLLKTSFWKVKVNFVVYHLILKISSQVLLRTFQRKYTPFISSLTLQILLSLWTRVSALSMHLTGIVCMPSFLFNRYLTFFLLLLEEEGAVCVCIVHCSLGWMASLNLF